MTRLHQQWQTYLSTHPMANLLWQKIVDTGLSVKIPMAMPLEEDDADNAILQFAWDQGDHHLDIDLISDGTLDWFYCNRKSNKADSGEGSDVVDDKLCGYFHLFLEEDNE